MKKILKVTVVILSVLILGFVLLIYLGFNGNPISKVKYKKEISSYLEKKYEGNFVINKMFFDFKDGTYGAYVLSKKYPKVIFEVEQNREYKKKNDQFYDNYQEKVWTYQINKEVLPELKKIFGENVSLRTDTMAKTKEVNFKKIKQISNYKKEDIDTDLLIDVYKDWKTIDKRVENEKMKKLNDYLKKENILNSTEDRVIYYFEKEPDATNFTTFTYNNKGLKME